MDVVFLGRSFVGVTAYSLDNFSRNSHIVQVRCQAAAESMPAVPLGKSICLTSHSFMKLSMILLR
jgi:hypothetical protein